MGKRPAPSEEWVEGESGPERASRAGLVRSACAGPVCSAFARASVCSSCFISSEGFFTLTPRLRSPPVH